jgi:calcineurin-like phosphoesterase family protein
MANIFFASDHHFGHEGMLKFVANDGWLVRPEFKDVEHMNETIIRLHNSVVKPSDHCYFLGDVAMKRPFLQIVKRLNGKKRLVFGNHDIFDYEYYSEVGFKKLMGMRVMEGIIFTHVPVHPSQLLRFKTNVHGHLHSNLVRLENGEIDPRYRSVCVEKINYTPISLDELRN